MHCFYRPANQISTSDRIVQLDGLRGCAVLTVFLHHSLGIRLLWAGVDLFFVLSGFLITGILLDHKERSSKGFGRFYFKRARRILPPYIALLLLFTLWHGTTWTNHWYLYLFFLMNAGSAFFSTPLQILWSLAVEEQFYLFWPVIVRRFTLQGIFYASCGCVITAPFLRAIFTPVFHSHFPIYFLTPFRMDTLAAGALLAWLWKYKRLHIDKSMRFATILGLSGITGLTALCFLFHLTTDSNTMLGNTLIYECTLCIAVSALLLALKGNGIFHHFLLFRPLRFIGTISYSMYLVHTLFIEWLRDYTHSRAMVMAFSLAATVGYASASWLLIELRLTRQQVPDRLRLTATAI